MKVRVYGVPPEENRRSMSVCGESLSTALRTSTQALVDYYLPTFRPYLSSRFANPAFYKCDVLLNRLRYALPTGRVDIHHVIDHSYGHLLHRLPEQTTVVTCHDLNIFHVRRSGRNPLRHRLYDYILRGFARARWVICVSKFTAQELLRSGLIKDGHIEVIPQGIHQAFRVVSQARVEAVCRQYNLPPGPLLIHVGDCFERKNIEGLLQILARVRAHHPVQLLKVGGVFSDEQKSLIVKLGLGEAILHLQNVPLGDLVALYNRADLCVFPSWLEGFGFPVLEAMACGVPLVASNRSSIPELVAEAGLLADPADVDSFVAQILPLLECPKKRQHLRDAGLIQAGRFSWEAHARQATALYERMAEAAR